MPSFAVDTYELRGNGISLDANIDDPILYKSSLRLEFTSLSEVSRGFINSEITREYHSSHYLCTLHPWRTGVITVV